MKTKRAFKKTNAQWIELPSQPLGEGEALSTNRVRTYSIRVKLDAPYPSPQIATTRNIDGEFVWERLVTCKGRAEAVAIAGRWFENLRGKATKNSKGSGVPLIGKEIHESVTVDDNWKECLYGSNFNPKFSCNRLLDAETIERVIEDSKGNLKVADSPFVKGQAHPALEWKTTKRVNDDPIKIAFSTYSDPAKGGMKETIEKAVEKASERKRNKQVPWLKEVENEDARRIVRKMRKDGTIEHSGVFLKDAQVNSVLSRKQKTVKNLRRGKMPMQTIDKEDADKWIQQQETKSL